MCILTFSPLPFGLMVNAKQFPRDTWKELKKEKKKIGAIYLDLTSSQRVLISKTLVLFNKSILTSPALENNYNFYGEMHVCV